MTLAPSRRSLAFGVRRRLGPLEEFAETRAAMDGVLDSHDSDRALKSSCETW